MNMKKKEQISIQSIKSVIFHIHLFILSFTFCHFASIKTMENVIINVYKITRIFNVHGMYENHTLEQVIKNQNIFTFL